jgi:fructosamine-3-kinase
MVTTDIPGETWSEMLPQLKGEDAHHVYRQLGRAVAELHTLRFPECGEIGVDGAVIRGAPFHLALMERARQRIANARHADLFVYLLAERAALFSDITWGALCHDDLNPHNIIMRNAGGRWQLAALLDFDSAWAGSPESDIARLELWRGMAGEGFHQAYEAVHPMASLYPDRRPLYQLLWCLEYARSTPQHLADTAAVCATLGIAPVIFP